MRRGGRALVLVGACLGLALAWGRARAPLPEAPSPSVEHPEISGRREVTRLAFDPPRPAFDFTLLDQDGRPFTLSDQRGKVVLLSFIYTSCPDACPMLASYYTRIQRDFAGPFRKGELVIAIATVDPDADTPARLKEYVATFGGAWRFLSGSQVQLKPVWDAYRIHREVRERNQHVVIYHSYRSQLFDRLGRWRIEHSGLWDPADVERDLKALLAEAP